MSGMKPELYVIMRVHRRNRAVNPCVFKEAMKNDALNTDEGQKGYGVGD